MEAHHGQCQKCKDRPYTAAEIAEAMARAAPSGDEGVGAFIPRCPTCPGKPHVMFNGCLTCGHLFASIRWDAMPVWDEHAKGRLETAMVQRRAANLLAVQVRREAALLAHERAARDEAVAWATGDQEGLEKATAEFALKHTPPPQPAPLRSIKTIGCGPDCTRSHSGDGNCLVCGQGWGSHSGHNCNFGPERGARGSWVVSD